MKNFKKVLALVLVVAMMMSFVVVASAKAYTDEKTISNKEAVDVLSYIGVLGGYPDESFKPTNAITRAEAAKIIAIFKNGSTDISDLYKTANTFADVKGNWAESYVAYCAKAGIVSGRNENTFDPSANVTGIEFLKMALVVLGLDADAEGYKGAAWQVNILEDAKQVGLLAGLGKNWNPAAAITREEAAQVMLNALESTKYEYGIAPKLGIDLNKVHEAYTMYGMTEKTIQVIIDSIGIWVTKAGAVATKTRLMNDWNLRVEYDDDVFARPIKVWYDTKATYANHADDEKVTTVAIAPVAEYTVATKKCDVLADAGIKKTDTTTAVEYYIDGAAQADLKHNDTTCKTDKVGGQGALTQTFFFGDKYRVVTINTWLGKVTKVTPVKATVHTDAYTAVTVRAFDKDAATNYTDYVIKSETLKKGDFVLVTWSAKEPTTLQSADVVTPSATAALKGKSASQSQLGDVVYDNAAMFFLLNPNNTVADAATMKTPNYNVYCDKYGNVIGLVDATPDKVYNYGLIDEIAYQPSIGLADEYIAANLIGMDTAAIKNIVIANAWDDADAAAGSIVLNAALEPQNTSSVSHDKTKNGAYNDMLYKWYVDEDGKYVIVDTGFKVGANDINTKTADPYVKQGTVPATICNDDTVYLVKTGTAAAPVYTQYVGYKNIPSMTGAKFLCVFDDETGAYAAYVYIDATTATFTGTKEVAVIFKDVAVWEGISTNKYGMYIEGAYVEKEAAQKSLPTFTGAGAYYVNYDANGKIVSVERIPAADFVEIDAAYFNGTVIRDATNVAYNGTPAIEQNIYLIHTTSKNVTCGTTADAANATTPVHNYMILNDAGQVVMTFINVAD